MDMELTPRLLRYILVAAVLGFVYGWVIGDCVGAWLAAQQWQPVVWMAA
jgi:hypothetical protein